MDTKAFRYFNAVYEEGNIHEAARKLFISPQGLGKIIRTLESEFDTTFFIRSKTGIVPTESGVEFYRWSKDFANRLNLVHDRIKEIDASRLSLRVAIANGTAKAYDMDRFEAFLNFDSNIDVQIYEYENLELIEKLLSSEVDIGFVIGKSQDNRISQSLSLSLPLGMMVYKGHPFFEKEALNIADLKNEELISMNENFRIYHILKDACLAEGFEPNIKLVAADGETLNRFCEKKMGLAFTPKFLNMNIKDTRFIPFENRGMTWDIYMTWLKDKENMTAIQAFKKRFEV